MKIDIKKVIVQTGVGADRVYLETNYPSPVPFIDDGPLGLTFDVAAGKGLDYVVYTLQIEPDLVEVVNRKPFKSNFCGR